MAYLSGWTWGRGISAMKASLQTGIWTRDLPNTKHECLPLNYTIQLGTTGQWSDGNSSMKTNLHKYWDNQQSSDDSPIIWFPGQDMKSSNSSFYYLFHSHSISIRSRLLATTASNWGPLKSHYIQDINKSLNMKLGICQKPKCSTQICYVKYVPLLVSTINQNI